MFPSKVIPECQEHQKCTILSCKQFFCFDSSEGPGPFPGLLDLWGGGGQLVEYRAALLASHGFASLTLNYLSLKITEETGKLVDNQYFEVNLMSV